MQSACRLHSSPACSEHSARVLRAAPLPPRAWSALHEARAWHAARTLRHPFSPLSSLPAHSTEHTLPACAACLHTQQSTQHTAPCARIRLTTQPAPHNNSLPHASPRRPALTPPAARSEKLQRAPLPTPAVSLHSETFSIHPAAAPPRAHSPPPYPRRDSASHGRTAQRDAGKSPLLDVARQTRGAGVRMRPLSMPRGRDRCQTSAHVLRHR